MTEVRHGDQHLVAAIDCGTNSIRLLITDLADGVAEELVREMRINLPRALVEEMLIHLSREKMIEVKGQIAVGATRYAMLDRGWDRVARVRDLCGYVGPAPISPRRPAVPKVSGPANRAPRSS